MPKDLGKLITDPKIPGFTHNSDKLGDIISQFYYITLTLAGFMAFFWFVWGAFQYILARGDKEQLARARARITWAIIGLVIIILAYFITNFAVAIFPPEGGTGF